MGYTVRKGDSWESIAGQLYGNQRMFTQLQSANKGIGMLKPGMVINTPSQASLNPNPVITQQQMQGSQGYSTGGTTQSTQAGAKTQAPGFRTPQNSNYTPTVQGFKTPQNSNYTPATPIAPVVRQNTWEKLEAKANGVVTQPQQQSTGSGWSGMPSYQKAPTNTGVTIGANPRAQTQQGYTTNVPGQTPIWALKVGEFLKGLVGPATNPKTVGGAVQNPFNSQASVYPMTNAGPAWYPQIGAMPNTPLAGTMYQNLNPNPVDPNVWYRMYGAQTKPLGVPMNTITQVPQFGPPASLFTNPASGPQGPHDTSVVPRPSWNVRDIQGELEQKYYPTYIAALKLQQATQGKVATGTNLGWGGSNWFDTDYSTPRGGGGGGGGGGYSSYPQSFSLGLTNWRI